MQPATDLTSPLHHYGTRIRQNSSSLKHASRTRSSPDPSSSTSRAAKPSQSSTFERIHPHNYPKFPPDDVVLHPDDANSKVFLAIGRAFMSVDNRAMTIKDLAEMTANYGLVCQNYSAAGQAITTYIRNHLQRCEEQDDQPLLLRHDLAGNVSDDDLAPGLYSRSGGAHCPKSENRLTNFRRGTSVWYLSRATGAPCPFARANIRLCDYVGGADKPSAASAGPSATVPYKRIQQAESRGQKRKRRTRNGAGGLDDGENTSDASGLEDTPPPPKVKLTLRLKPLVPRTPAQPSLSITSREVICLDSDEEASSSEDDADGMSDMQDEAPRSCLPKYPKRAMSIPSSEPVFYGASPFCSSTDRPFSHRSPSVPTNMSSPPPDSEEEYMDSESDADCDADLESDVDGESFGPRSPSAPAMASTTRVSIKADYGDALEVWDEDIPAADFSLQVYQTGELLATKMEDMDWHSPMYDHGAGWYSPVDAGSPSSVDVKQEEADLEYSLLSPISQAYSPSSPSETRRHSDFAIGSSGGSFIGVEQDVSSSRTRSATAAVPLPPTWSSPPAKDALSLPPLTPTSSTLSTMLGTLSVQSPTVASPMSPLTPLSECPATDNAEPMVYHTSRPCSPAIIATHVEGVLAYQMLLGTSRLLRRVDSDFVNLTPIVNYLGFAPTLPKELADGLVISQGSSLIIGNWVPLATARSFVQEHPVPAGLLDDFLSSTLYEGFPDAVQDVHRSSMKTRELNQYGTHFASTIAADQTQNAALPMPHPPLSPSLILPLVSQSVSVQESGISEEELFQQFCCIPDSEKEHAVSSDSPSEAMDVIEVVDEDKAEQEAEVAEEAGTEDVPSRSPSPKPLRRSKRVADAAAASQPAPPKPRRRRGRKSSS